MSWRRSIPGLALAICACGIDFLGPESPALLTATVALVDSASTTVRVRGVLDPGLLESGDPREVADDTVRLLTLTIAPALVDELGRRSYDRVQALDLSALNSPDILLTPPQVANTAGNPSSLSTVLVWRDGPHALQVPRGTDVILSLANVQRIDTTDARVFWSLDITEPATDTDRQFFFQLSASGRPPGSIIIPASIVEEAGRSTFDMRLQLSFGVGSATDTRDYVAHLSTFATIYWTVALVDP